MKIRSVILYHVCVWIWPQSSTTIYIHVISKLKQQGENWEPTQFLGIFLSRLSYSLIPFAKREMWTRGMVAWGRAQEVIGVGVCGEPEELASWHLDTLKPSAACNHLAGTISPDHVRPSRDPSRDSWTQDGGHSPWF